MEVKIRFNVLTMLDVVGGVWIVGMSVIYKATVCIYILFYIIYTLGEISVNISVISKF